MATNLHLLVGRILLALIFVFAGFAKLADPGTIDNAWSTAGMIAGKGLPLAVVLAYLAGLVELLGGLAILVGFQTRLAAWALAAFSVAAGLLFHTGTTGDAGMDVINQIMLMKNLAIAGGFLALAAHGAGAWSLDARRTGSLATA
jgi:putative oxidoreductase